MDSAAAGRIDAPAQAPVTATTAIKRPPIAVPAEAASLGEGEVLVQRVDPATLVPKAPDPSAPPVQVKLHKDFTDPPLPAELKDDGGLTPLPPGPARN